MSDSDSSDEDLSRFKDVVDTSFIKSLNQPTTQSQPDQKRPSERYLEVSSHYNDVKVPDKLQKQIGDKISAILSKTIEYVDVHNKCDLMASKIEGGVKLFRDSKGFLSCEEINDKYTENHNINSKKLKSQSKRRFLDNEDEESSENDKINSVAVSGEVILTGQETKYWKSRRKEKVYKYKTNGKSKALIAVD
ncbi:uncharacterized protein LOC121728384 [Aricia agestis]|uniref:uncharacterized protein LOC121728384 n=1 Tax=Aricia agestis TaxID=91739 RepID=UPI001C207B43|nr:uncharacterized protein LOC121728384 [Aricia agestis]